jgi:hypothetical protein
MKNMKKIFLFQFLILFLSYLPVGCNKAEYWRNFNTIIENN